MHSIYDMDGRSKMHSITVSVEKGHSTLRTLHPESKILEMKLFFTNLSFAVFI